MSTQPVSGRTDPLPVVAAILTLVGTALVATGIWTTVYSAENGGSATPYGLGDNGRFGGLVTNGWIVLLVAASLGVLALVPLGVAIVRRRKIRPVLAVGLVVLLAAATLATIILIAFITERDALGFDLSLSVAFYLVLGGIVAWILALVLTLVALVIPGKPPVPIGDGHVSAWPTTPSREPLLSSPPPPPPPPSPARAESPYPTAVREGATRPVVPSDEGATRALSSQERTSCPSCGASVDAGAKFCSSCGAAVPPPIPICRSCGAELREGDRFCRACGTPA